MREERVHRERNQKKGEASFPGGGARMARFGEGDEWREASFLKQGKKGKDPCRSAAEG